MKKIDNVIGMRFISTREPTELEQKEIEEWVEQRRKQFDELIKTHPYGEVVRDDIDGGGSVRARLDKDAYVCMTCGTSMCDYSHKKIVGRKWVEKTSPPYYSSWFCPRCNGVQPIVVAMSIRGTDIFKRIRLAEIEAKKSGKVEE